MIHLIVSGKRSVCKPLKLAIETHFSYMNKDKAAIDTRVVAVIGEL